MSASESGSASLTEFESEFVSDSTSALHSTTPFGMQFVSASEKTSVIEFGSPFDFGSQFEFESARRSAFASGSQSASEFGSTFVTG